MATTCQPIDEWTKKYIHYGIVFRLIKNEQSCLLQQYEWNWGHYAKWNKTEKNRHCMISLTCIVKFKKLGIQAMYCNIIKAICDKPTANIILSDERLKAFLLSSRTRQGCPFWPLLLNLVLEVITRAIRQEKEIKIIRIRNEEVSVSIYRWHDFRHRNVREKQTPYDFTYMHNLTNPKVIKKRDQICG